LVETPEKKRRPPGVASLLKPYRGWMALLVILTVGSSGLGLVVPLVIAHAIDAFKAGNLDLTASLTRLLALLLGLGNLQVLR
jgi:ATP-binding cassette subfamily B protein